MIHMFTDGSCIGNPGPGGWAALIIDGKKKKELVGGMSLTTNNTMELTAAVEALSRLYGQWSNEVLPTEYGSTGLFSQSPAVVSRDTIIITLDSEYVRKGITEWIHTRVLKGRRTAGRKPVQNVELWQTLYYLVQCFPGVVWEWTKGHTGHPENEHVDQLARKKALSFHR